MNGESTDSSLPLESSYLQWNKEFKTCLILIGSIHLLPPCNQMKPYWLKMLFVPAARFIGIFLTVTSLFHTSAASMNHASTAHLLQCPVHWGDVACHRKPAVILWQQCERHTTCRASGLQALLMVLVAGRYFTVLLITENTTHQLDLIKASPYKQSNYNANIQNAREHTFF